MYGFQGLVRLEERGQCRVGTQLNPRAMHEAPRSVTGGIMDGPTIPWTTVHMADCSAEEQTPMFRETSIAPSVSAVAGVHVLGRRLAKGGTVLNHMNRLLFGYVCI